MIGDVAQLGEHLLCKQGVVGSIPIVSRRRVPARRSEVIGAPVIDVPWRIGA